MMERACGADKPFDKIVFYSFNRFFRNGADMELAIRKLRKHGVEVVSVTQLRIPIEAGQVFRREAGHRSDLMSATIPK